MDERRVWKKLMEIYRDWVVAMRIHNDPAFRGDGDVESFLKAHLNEETTQEEKK